MGWNTAKDLFRLSVTKVLVNVGRPLGLEPPLGQLSLAKMPILNLRFVHSLLLIYCQISTKFLGSFSHIEKSVSGWSWIIKAFSIVVIWRVEAPFFLQMLTWISLALRNILMAFLNGFLQEPGRVWIPFAESKRRDESAFPTLGIQTYFLDQASLWPAANNRKSFQTIAPNFTCPAFYAPDRIP